MPLIAKHRPDFMASLGVSNDLDILNRRSGDVMTDAEQIRALTRLVAALTKRMEAAERRMHRMEAMAALLPPDVDICDDDAPEPTRSAMRNIAEAIAIQSRLRVADLRGPSRVSRVAHPRQEAYRRCKLEGYSLHQIGNYFGGRHHTTVLMGIRSAEKRGAQG